MHLPCQPSCFQCFGSVSIHHPYHRTAGAATAEDMQWIKAVKIRDEGLEDMIEFQGDGAREQCREKHGRGWE